MEGMSESELIAVLIDKYTDCEFPYKSRVIPT